MLSRLQIKQPLLMLVGDFYRLLFQTLTRWLLNPLIAHRRKIKDYHGGIERFATSQKRLERWRVWLYKQWAKYPHRKLKYHAGIYNTLRRWYLLLLHRTCPSCDGYGEEHVDEGDVVDQWKCWRCKGSGAKPS